ncbi:MAG: TetR/AcrR family transcriptional regulator [Lachnospiraceae bacterium]|nr:TetR/AcrR family transcriptional regulator [Lachnospiraceae bacterium]
MCYTNEGTGKMARRESVTRDVIIDAAFSILREEGIEQVTARKLAARANCSTQPIFRIFKNMEELAQELYDRTACFFREYYDSFPRHLEAPFVHLGMIYIRFALEHGNLFSFLFLSGKRFAGNGYDMMRGWEDCTAGQIRPASESCENAGEVFARMWVTIHGAACMTLAGDYDLTEEETANMLEDICRLYCK